MKNPFTPRGFLQLAFVVLFAAGLLSFIVPNGVLPVLGELWWFDVFEGIFHFTIAFTALIGSLVLSDRLARWLVLIIGIGAVTVGLFGLFLTNGPIGSFNTFGLANLENPADNLFHLSGGVWALAVVWLSRARSKQ